MENKKLIGKILIFSFIVFTLWYFGYCFSLLDIYKENIDLPRKIKFPLREEVFCIFLGGHRSAF